MPYIDAHKAIVKANNPRQPEKWVLIEHNRTFMPWFKNKVLKDSTTFKTLIWLAAKFKFDVISYLVYEANSCIFYTKFMDVKSTIQNCCVTLEVDSMQFSTSKDTNPVVGSMACYGINKRYERLTIISFLFQFSSINQLTIRVGLKLMNQDLH